MRYDPAAFAVTALFYALAAFAVLVTVDSAVRLLGRRTRRRRP